MRRASPPKKPMPNGLYPHFDVDLKGIQMVNMHLGKYNDQLPSGVDLTLTELQEMAARQQQQIESQQQILVAKEQRLKFLKHQEMKHEQIVSENERLRTLREKVEAQELKLKKLRALRGQVDQHKQSNSNLTSELESIKALFNEKEKELSIAVAKVDELSGQLDHIRQSNAKGGMLGDNNNRSVSSLEVERLRRELLIRNKLNEQQSTKIISQKDKLIRKKEEIGSVDKRIEELTSRLRKKRAQQTHQQNVQNKAAQYASQNKGGKGPNIAAVEPYVKHVPQEVKDDMFSKADVGGFKPNKNDPKYQTLPANIKFPLGSENNSETVVYTQQSKPKDSDQRLGNIKQHGRPDTGNVHKIGQNFMSYGPRPYGSSYSSTITNTVSGKDGGIRGQPEGLTSSAQNSPTIQEGSKMFTSTPVTTETSTSGPQQPPPYSTATPVGVTNSRPAYSSVSNEQRPSVSNLAPGQGLRPTAPFYQGNTSTVPSPITQSGTQQSAINLAPSSVPNQQPRPFVAYGRQSQDTQPTEAPLSGHAAAPPGGSQIADVPGTMAGGAKHTYRYAPKSVIANTYMKKLGQSTLDQYRQNMMQLYKDFYPKSSNIGGPSRTEPEQPASPTAKVRPMIFEKPSNTQQKEGAPTVLTNSTSQPPPYPSVPAYESNQDNKVQRRSKSTSDEVAPVNQAPVPVPETSTSFIDDPREQGGVDKYSYPPYAPPIAPEAPPTPQSEPEPENKTQGVFLKKRTNLKKENSKRSLMKRRVSFDPLALLLDASLEGELELVQKAASQVKDVSQPNDEGITALHNAICAGHYEIVKFLVEFGCDVNSPDSDGWTPLHCAASCNNLPMVKFLVEHGACIFAATISDQETAAEKCEEDEDGYDGCSEYLYSVQEKLGILNSGAVFAVFEYKAQNNDELNFKLSDKLVVLRKGDDTEKEWWWTKKKDREGYIPRNLIGLYPRVQPASKPST